MKHSITFYLILFILKLKGVKKSFSRDPVDYLKLRREDIHEPKGRFFSSGKITQFEIEKTVITQIKSKDDSNKGLLLFIHGGAFVSGPAKHHWDTCKAISNQTNLTIWMCNYPKAPEHKITEISKNIDAVYRAAVEKYSHDQIRVIGDSVGGTLVTALMQRLVINKIALPNQIILVSPVLDATISNKEIEEVDKIDPMLSQKGVLSAKKMCLENEALNDPMISPINGSFEQFPKTILFLAENDITYPDQQILVQKLKSKELNFEVIYGKGMPHIWPLLPVMREAKVALNQIIKKLNQ